MNDVFPIENGGFANVMLVFSGVNLSILYMSVYHQRIFSWSTSTHPKNFNQIKSGALLPSRLDPQHEKNIHFFDDDMSSEQPQAGEGFV